MRLFRKKRANKTETAAILTKHRGADKILFTIVFIIFTVHCLTLLLPVFWMLMSSFKEANEYFIGDPFALPETWHFENYPNAFKELNAGNVSFLQMSINSIWYTALATGSSLVGPVITGYVLSKYNFRGKNIIYAVAIFSITIPIVGTGAAGMKLVAQLGLYDNPLKLVINAFNGFTGPFLVYYGFYRSVSWAYAEAAEIDGAGPFTIFFRIMLPQGLPMIMTYAITTSIAEWNAYESIILYFPSFPTIAAGLFTYKSNAARANFPVYYSGLILSMLPALLIFTIFSGKIMTSISVGGLKG